MTYESARYIFGMAGLFMFILLFAVVVVWVLWLGNQKGFEEASRIPLQNEDLNVGGSNGR